MNTLNSDFKEKPKRGGRAAALDFVVPLQLEDCIYRIQQLPPSQSLELTAERLTEAHQHENVLDTARFRVILRRNGKTIARAKGKLQRWEGTSTRFKGDIQYELETAGLGNFLWFLVKCVVIFYGVSLTVMAVIITLLSDTVLALAIGIILGVIVLWKFVIRILMAESRQITAQIKTLLSDEAVR